MNNSPQRAAKGFTRAFWVSNTVELFERMAYYAVFIVLTIYLSSILGFNDFEASMISGLFSGGLYLLPIFSGAYADKIGFRKSMIIAFSLLSIGYLGLGVLSTLLEAAGLVSYGATTQFNGLPDSYTRWIIVPVLFVLMVGGSFIKSIISASVAKETIIMKKIFILVCSCALLAACNNSAKTNKSVGADSTSIEVTDIHNAENSLDYEGTYKGVFPAADCPGIETTLTLNPDKTFSLHSVYIDRDSSFDEKGTYTLKDNLLTLNEEGGELSYYKVEENHLRKLTMDKQEITGELADHYVLNKE
jgi:uncharacterized lipoprotein NlpE involved in copper resistance